MDSDRFDRLAQWMGAGNRRQVLGSALGGAAVLLGVGGQEGVAARKRGKPVTTEGPCGDGGVNANRCKRNGQCCTGVCDKGKGKKPYGRCRCRKLNQSCQEDRNCCATAGQPMSCVANVCVSTDPGPDPVNCTGLKPTGSSPTQGLKEAIDAAEAGDTLTLCAGTWNLTEGVFIPKNLTLIGAGAGATVLDGGNAVRVLEIAMGATVTVQDLTATKGNANYGGGIRNNGTLMLLGVSVTDSTATNWGGGISNSNPLTLDAGCRVTGNTAPSGGGIYNYYGTATLEEGSSVTGNNAVTSGSGIYNDSGTVTLDSGAIVCSNIPLNSQCVGTISGTCPAPSQTCPS